MKHSSIKLPEPCEFINITPFNPLISKCQIKVCYVGDEPNRNKSIITKEVATQMANSLPGSPIVGFYDEETQDFDEHTKELVIENGTFSFKSKTRPYGFVDLNAKVWFQKFLDDGVNEREYLMTEGWLWTGQYPECQRVIDKGNNESMELDKKIIDAYWTKDSNGKPQFFIINEAIFSKLCILGEEKEPCFEGSGISVNFSLSAETQEIIQTMVYQLQEFIDKGGNSEMPEIKEDKDLEFKTKEQEEKEEEKKQNDSEQTDTDKTENKTEDVKKEDEDKDDDEKKKKTDYEAEICPKCGKPVSECTCKNDYSLDEIPEYVELQKNYNELETKFSAQEQEIETLKADLSTLTAFKAKVEKKEKENMIKGFYMLSDEDKKDVVDHIDEYSLDDIEAKLSILCVRNKVNFSLEEEKAEEKPTTYTLSDDEISAVPAWAKAVIANQQANL